MPKKRLTQQDINQKLTHIAANQSHYPINSGFHDY